MSPVLLGYQQIMALLVRGEFCVQQRVVRLDGFIGSFDERTVDINGLMVKCFANGLFELSSHSRQSQDPFQIAIFVELVSDSLSPIQKNLLPRFFNLLRSRCCVNRFETNQTDRHSNTLLPLTKQSGSKAGLPLTPFQLTDIDWVKLNEAKAVLRQFACGIDLGPETVQPQTQSSKKNQTQPIQNSHSLVTPKTNTTSPVLRTIEMHQDNSRGFFSSPPELTSGQLAELKKHVINLNSGKFSTDGEFTTSKQEVQAIFDRHIFDWMDEADKDDLDLVFYSHGGLTNEAWGLATAHHQVNWWKENGVYPIFFVWETGLLETIWQLIKGRDDGARGIFDGITNAVSEVNDRVWETVFRTAQVPTLWAGMKSSAHLSFEDSIGGAGNTVLESVFEFISGIENEVRLHAVGHSAGSIFVSHMIAAANQYEEFPKFETGHFLAPAISNDLFRRTLMPLIGRAESDQLKHLSIFTMSDGLEKKDTVGPYGKSLLYLIYHALEAEKQTHILGLEHSLYAQNDIADFFGLVGPESNLTDVIFSKTPPNASLKSRSLSTKHGDFDDDPATMESVLRRIIKANDNQNIAPFPTAGPRRPTALPTPSFTSSGPEEHVFPEADTGNRNSKFRSSANAKRALCIGIDHYPNPQDRLNGCENDAEQWATWLRSAGFETTVLKSAQATRQGIVSAIKGLSSNSRSGDAVAIQFACHGTQMPDQNGDEIGGDSPGKDEAIVPVDYQLKGLLRDDDIGELCNDFREGVSVTLIMDNCSSGSASRMFINKRSQAKPTGDRKARCIVATNEMVKIDLQARKDRGTTRSFNPYDGTNEILFAACQSTEYAYESNGGGDFTRHALKILNETGGNLSCKDFMRLIRKAFGLDAKQTPGLWCNSSLEDSGFLGATHRTAEFGDEQFGSSDSAYAKAIGQIKSIVDRMEG